MLRLTINFNGKLQHICAEKGRYIDYSGWWINIPDEEPLFISWYADHWQQLAGKEIDTKVLQQLTDAIEECLLYNS